MIARRFALFEIGFCCLYESIRRDQRSDIRSRHGLADKSYQ